MVSSTSNEFITTRDWHRAIVGGKNLILRNTSALEHLQLFSGYVKERTIDVYARRRGEYENINYHVVDTFDSIDYLCIGNVLCTSVSQTINDMLSDYSNIDEQSLIEGLSKFFYMNNGFDGLSIKPENIERFNGIRDWAIEYYDEV